MTQSTEEILNHHLQSFGAGDLAGILSDYADEALMITPDGTAHIGPAQIQPVFEGMIAEFAKPGASFSMGLTTIRGDVAFITWSAETADNIYELGTDTFIVGDGKIVVQTFAVKATPKG